VTEIVSEGIVFEAGRLWIESPEPREGLHVHYDVSVPFATLVHLVVLNGPVEVRGIDGPLEVTLTNGPIRIEEIGGAVEVELTNGPMHLQQCSGAVGARVSNGPIHVQGVTAPVRLTVSNGPISIEDASASIKASATNGPIVYRGQVGGNFDMRSSRGGIVVEVPGDSRFELDAEAERGEVHCDFDVKDQASEPADQPWPRIVLRSERGEIVVRERSRAGVS
jgi:hypothetical protein